MSEQRSLDEKVGPQSGLARPASPRSPSRTQLLHQQSFNVRFEEDQVSS